MIFIYIVLEALVVGGGVYKSRDYISWCPTLRIGLQGDLVLALGGFAETKVAGRRWTMTYQKDPQYRTRNKYCNYMPYSEN